MPSKQASKQAGVVDFADFAEKGMEGAYPDDTVFGDVPFARIPDVIGKDSSERERDVPDAGMGDLGSTGSTGNFGDIYE